MFSGPLDIRIIAGERMSFARLTDAVRANSSGEE
jgi:hypothetical protein